MDTHCYVTGGHFSGKTDENFPEVFCSGQWETLQSTIIVFQIIRVDLMELLQVCNRISSLFNKVATILYLTKNLRQLLGF